MRRTRAGAIFALTLALSFCGGTGAPPAGPAPPATTYRITIGTNGLVTPAELIVPPGTRVLFTNNHSVRHDMASDPHPEHSLCPELNQVGLLNPGQSRETGNLVALRTCGFHDHEDFDNQSLRGRIIIR